MQGKKVVINFIWRFMERISAQLVTFIVSIILARILMPEDYGVISILMVFITFANVLVCNGFATALIQKKNADEVDFSSVFYFSLAFSIVLYIIMFILAPFIAKWYNMPILSPTLRVLGLRVIIGAVNSVQQSYVSRKMIFKKFFFATLGGTIISAIVGIVMAYSGFGVWSLVFQYLTNTFIDTIVLWFTVKWRPQKKFSFTRLKGLLNYGWKLLASALVGTVYDDLRTLIIGKIYSNDDLAYYSRGQQFPKLIMTNVNNSITSVIFPVMSSIQTEKDRIANACRKTIQVSSGVITPIMFGMAAIATPMVKLLLTDKWLPCVPFLQLCCIYYLVSSYYSIYLQVYKALGRSGLALIIELVDDFVGILLIILFYRTGVLAIAIVMVVSRILACIICFPINKKLVGLNYLDQLKDVGLPIIGSLIMVLLISLLNLINTNYILLMFIEVLLGIIIYFIYIWIFKLPVFIYFKEMLRKSKSFVGGKSK